MPICKRADWAPATTSTDTFRDDEEVFFCDVTRQIFRNHEEYFRHTITINCTVWQCEETGKEGLTYTEALKSEKAARKKLKSFKEALRPVTMLIIDQAKQSSIKQLSNIAFKFLRERYFRQEEVLAQHKTNTYSSYIVEDIIPDSRNNVAVNSGTYEDTEKLKYKLRSVKADSSGKNVEFITVPFSAIRRQRSDLVRETMEMFIKKHVVRIDGILYAKPESYKIYVTDRNLSFGNLFIGKMPHFTPAKLKRPQAVTAVVANGKNQSSMKKYLEKPTLSAKEMAKREELKQAKQNEKEKLLREQMERIKREKLEKLAQLEREKQEKKAKLMERIEQDCKELLLKTDDLDRKDQRLLPPFKLIKTLIPMRYIGDALMLAEFMKFFSSQLSGMEVFRAGVTLSELTRAFTVREVAGPLADILLVLLNTIFDLQRDEDEETGAFKYSVGYSKHWKTEKEKTISHASRTHWYVKRHYSFLINQLPVDSQTLSEVLRLHLLSSGATPTDRVMRWRVMYRAGYYSSEDPGLNLRLENPHILRALRNYTVFQLPFSDIVRIIQCLMAQILTYSNTQNYLDEHMEKMWKLRTELRNMIVVENRRLSQLQMEKKNLLNTFKQSCGEEAIKNDAGRKEKLEQELNKKIAVLDLSAEREQKKHTQQLEKLQSNLFTQFTELGMDRAYRKYYMLHSVPGLFIEHPKDCLDYNCLTDPPQQNADDSLRTSTANVPKNRAALSKHLMKIYTEEEKKQEKIAKEALLLEKDRQVHQQLNSQENKENQVTQVIESEVPSASLLNGHSVADALSTDANNHSKASTAAPTSTPPPPPPPTAYQLYMCTGEKHNCIVHNEHNTDRQRWAFVYERQQIDALIDALNPLGDRESLLREQLIMLRQIIYLHVRNCPHNLLHMDARQVQKFRQQIMNDTQFKYSKSNFGYSFNDLNEVMHVELVERLIKFEHDIYTGNLGRLKVNDMEKWRNDLFANEYDPQVKLQWTKASNLKQSNGNVDEGIETYDDDDNGALEIDFYETDPNRLTLERRVKQSYCDPGELLGNNDVVDSEESDDEEQELSMHESMQESSLMQGSIRNLASALLQIEQGIERRFMKEPFGASPKNIKDKEMYKRQLQIAALNISQWEMSLMESTSYSQVFLHLNILHDCIIWSRSTNKSMCLICRRGSEPDKMLLCDECNSGTHMFCMKPKMKTVPEGSWYCRRCVGNLGLKNEQPKQAKETKQRRRAFVIDEEDNRSEGGSSSSGGQQAVKGRRSKRLRSAEIEQELHAISDGTEVDDEEDDKPLATLNGNAESENEEDEDEHDDNDEEDEEEQEDNEEEEQVEDVEMKSDSIDSQINETDDDDDGDGDQQDGDDNTCIVCSYDGADIMCARCKDIYHTECANLKRKPRYNFICSNCKDKEDKKRKHKSNDDTSDFEDDTDHQPKRKRSSRFSLRNSLTNDVDASHKTTPTTTTTKNSRLSGRRTGENLLLDIALLLKLLDEIMKNENAWPFLRPVSLAAVPDYLEIVKNPIDFAKIKSKLNRCDYKTNDEVLSDISLVFQNCENYNANDNEIYIAGCALEQFVKRRCKEYNLKFTPSEMNA